MTILEELNFHVLSKALFFTIFNDLLWEEMTQKGIILSKRFVIFNYFHIFF
jgi:hypothetical protein